MKSKVILFIAMLLLGIAPRAGAQVSKTLFELSGVEKPKIDLDHSMLVIIDAQEEYRTGQLPLPGVDVAVRSIRNLLKEARRKGVPVVHVLHEGTAGGLFDPATKYFKSITGLEPRENEVVISKHFPNAFAETSLAAELKKLGKDRTLLFAGFMTHMCITSTASAALDLGFVNAIVTDAVATRDLRGPNGETIPAEVVNRASLASLQDRIAWLVKSQDL